jgi:Phosphoribosylcarboxyaminoimidazole (NCAIR) mutase
VATVAINGSKNAALLAIRILAVSDSALSDKLKIFMERQTKAVMEDSL